MNLQKECYTNVSNEDISNLAITPEMFLLHMDLLNRYQYCVISLAEAVQRIKLRRSLAKTIVITFDDAYNDFYMNAIPVLRKFNYPSTVFIVTNSIGVVSQWNVNSKKQVTMDWQQLKEIITYGVEVGSHSANHYRFSSLNLDNIKSEIVESFATLNQLNKSSFRAFSYPFGDVTNSSKIEIINAGYDCAVGAGGLWGNGFESDIYNLNRVLITKKTSIIDLYNILRGSFDFYNIINNLIYKYRMY